MRRALFAGVMAGYLSLPGACVSPPQSAPQGTAEPGHAKPQAEPLNARQLTAVIGKALPTMKQACWQPALNARPPDAEAAPVRIMAHFEIDPKGLVGVVRVDDEPPDYPDLGKCVVTVIKTLQFPASVAAPT